MHGVNSEDLSEYYLCMMMDSHGKISPRNKCCELLPCSTASTSYHSIFALNASYNPINNDFVNIVNGSKIHEIFEYELPNPNPKDTLPHLDTDGA